MIYLFCYLVVCWSCLIHSMTEPECLTEIKEKLSDIPDFGKEWTFGIALFLMFLVTPFIFPLHVWEWAKYKIKKCYADIQIYFAMRKLKKVFVRNSIPLDSLYELEAALRNRR